MNWKKVVLILMLICFGYAGNAGAAGFALYEWGSRGTSLGGTMLGRADDASAVAYNPAGITQLDGTRTQIGLSVVAPGGDIKTTDAAGSSQTTSIKSNYWIPPHAFLTHQLTDQAWLGLGVYSRFGLGTEYPDDWPGRYNSVFTRVQSLSFNPNLALKLSESWSLAFGGEIMWFDFNQERAINAMGQQVRSQDVDAKVSGDSYGIGANVALHYKPNDTWAVGFTYKSRVEHSLDGDARFDRPAVLPAGLFENTSAKGDITLPDSFGLGIMFRPMERLTLEANAIYTLWSTYDELRIDYGSPLNPMDPSTDTTVTDKKWRDVWRFQFGVEYDLNDLLDLRLGYVFDQIPDRDSYADYMTPTNHRNILNTGIGFSWEKASLDFSYSYLWFSDRRIDARAEDGVLDSKFKNGHTHIGSVSFSYMF
ncbi:outer membrane protein transport protein [Desulfonatronospira sp.]|uniref:OmpP1/FadL family transporter n=1 Tax=Desulfonatronospira sp. TaxID=1962951 RepID=UPI0025C2FF40|nr:outer membrane protein transport protein [Desulfonatronospira sp.]